MGSFFMVVTRISEGLVLGDRARDRGASERTDYR